MAQGENPILTDSHDDHLDNEFIIDELVRALRQGKEKRQIIIACRDDEGEISYMTGALENQKLRSKLLAVLEGGEDAFSKRQKKYRINL